MEKVICSHFEVCPMKLCVHKTSHVESSKCSHSHCAGTIDDIRCIAIDQIQYGSVL